MKLDKKLNFRLSKTIKIASLSTLIFLTGCSLSGSDSDSYANYSAKQIYDEAVTHLTKGRFEPAVKSYEALETHFPFGDITTKGQLELIYAYYKDQEHLQAITAAERFLRLHPLSNHADYVYYMKGIAHFEQGRSMASYWIPSNPALRDVSNYKEAFKDFKTLIHNFPSSEYATDARARMIYIRNLLAEHELNVADYYLQREAYLAAANRARYILEHLSNTPAEKGALEVMEKTYAKLKLTPLLDQGIG